MYRITGHYPVPLSADAAVIFGDKALKVTVFRPQADRYPLSDPLPDTPEWPIPCQCGAAASCARHRDSWPPRGSPSGELAYLTVVDSQLGLIW